MAKVDQTQYMAIVEKYQDWLPEELLENLWAQFQKPSSPRAHLNEVIGEFILAGNVLPAGLKLVSAMEEEINYVNEKVVD